MSGEPVKRALAVLTHPTLSLRDNARASVTRLEWCTPCGCAFYAMPRPRVMVCDAHRAEDKGQSLRDHGQVAQGGLYGHSELQRKVMKAVKGAVIRHAVRGAIADVMDEAIALSETLVPDEDASKALREWIDDGKALATGGPITPEHVNMSDVADKTIADAIARGDVSGPLGGKPVGGVHVVLDDDYGKTIADCKAKFGNFVERFRGHSTTPERVDVDEIIGEARAKMEGMSDAEGP